jgi:hypothetical protein
MNILEKRVHNDDVLHLISDLRFGKMPIELVGSASLRNQRYFSDYDFFSVTGKSTPYKTYEELNNIIRKISNNSNYYPIELKIQLDNGEKIKKFHPIDLSYDEFKSAFNIIDFIKIDLVLFTDSRFIEVSIIYKMNITKKFTVDMYTRELQKDIQELKKEKNYYKILKRYFNLARVTNNKDLMISLMKLFNSDVGQMYQYKSNLEAIKLVKDFYKNDDKVKQKIKVNYSKIRPIKMANYNELQNTINTKALEFITQHNIKI